MKTKLYLSIITQSVLNKKIITLIISLFVFGFSFGQLEIEWQKTIGGSLDDYTFSPIVQTTDGGYIVGGSSPSNISGDKTENCHGGFFGDYWVIKLDSTGNIQWQNTIGGDDNDQLYTILQTSDGGYLLGGSSSSGISFDKTENCIGKSDYWIVKLDTAGNIQWQNTIGGSDYDTPSSIVQTTDGGYFIGGSSKSDISGDKTENNLDTTLYTSDYWIIKLDAAGNIQWQNSIGGIDDDGLSSVQQTYDGGYILGGDSKSDSSADKTENNFDLGLSTYDCWVIKLDSAGNIQWQNTIGGIGDDRAFTIQQTFDGGYIVNAESNSPISGDKTENSLSYDSWIIKLDSFGNILWQSTLGGNDVDQSWDIQQTADSGYIVAATSPSGISGKKTENAIGHDDNWVIKLDNSGSIEWQKTIGGSHEDELWSALQTSDGGYIASGFSISNISGDKSENSKGGYDYWILKLSENFNLVTGNTFIDLNSNQIKDSTDISFQGELITESNTNRIAFSGQNGNYYLSVLDSGNFSVSPAPLNYYTTVPASHNVNFTGIKQTDSLNDFAFQPIAGINDLQITVTPITAFRPGFDAAYLLSYKNVGTTTLTASVVFYLDDTNYTYSSASVAPSLITLDSVLWNNITLAPWQQGSITVTVHVNAGVPIGTYLGSFCIINPIAGDNYTRDNYASWEVQVRGAIDPNDKLVSNQTFTTTQLADTNEYLDYIIHFQNTGTDTAFNVRVLDNIPVNLDLATFQLAASSHPFNMSYMAHSRLMTFTFDNILLPDSNTNQLASHGFIRYRIRPLSILAAGDTIKNTAFIYFDFNQPVQTNWAQTEIILPNSIADLSFDSEGSKLFPNPVHDVLNISLNKPLPPNSIITINDIQGRVVKEEKILQRYSSVIPIDVSALSQGAYLLRMDGVVRRFVKL